MTIIGYEENFSVCKVEDISGMGFDPLGRRWKATRDVGVNYILLAGKD